MKIVQINATCGIGSTGKICVGISSMLNEKDIENYIIYSSLSDGNPVGISCSDGKYIKFQSLKSRLLGNYGFNSVSATQKMITEIERIRPDVVHLHNIHGHDCNLEMLFSYFKSKQTRLVWTFHDCWAFTGYCTHFTVVGCDKWRSGCKECVQSRSYSWLFDKSEELYGKKKKLFENLNMTIVTPSVWLGRMVKDSFLKEYPLKVINNGIDLDIFRLRDSGFRKKYGLEDKKVILAVSFGWSNAKGLDVLIGLSHRLPEDYRLVIVGTDADTDRLLTDKVISIHRTQNQQELAEIYSAADLFVNPTREENYPTVNMEALACGTPVLTFRTGGSPEMLDEGCGSVVDCDDVDSFEKEIIRICTEKPYTRDACINKSKEFDKNERYKEYVRLYEGIDASGA